MELSSEELLCRKDTLKQFENYIHNATKTLDNFTRKIGWSLDKTPTEDSLVKYTFNSKQKIPSFNFGGSPQKKLEWNGYESLYTAYCSSSSSVNIEVKHEPEKNVQNTVDYTRDSLHLTTDERKDFYDSVTGKNLNPNPDDDSKNLLVLDLFNETNKKPKTELELLQEQRDLKRRRAAYRGKRVHTDRKSYTEVLREVVEGLTNSVPHQEDKSICVETSNINTTVSDNRCVYKYEGNRHFGGHPYTRWVDIKTEEYNLLKYYEEKNDSSQEEANTSQIHHSVRDIDTKKSRRSRSLSRSRRKSSSGLKRSKRSRSRSKYKEIKYKKSKRSRTPIKSNEVKSIKSKTRSKSKEIMLKKCRSRSVSTERKEEKIKRHRARSNSNECSPKKKSKHSKSPLNYLSSLSNENDINKYKSSSHKKKKKHKHKRKYSKSPK